MHISHTNEPLYFTQHYATSSRSGKYKENNGNDVPRFENRSQISTRLHQFIPALTPFHRRFRTSSITFWPDIPPTVCVNSHDSIPGDIQTFWEPEWQERSHFQPDRTNNSDWPGVLVHSVRPTKTQSSLWPVLYSHFPGSDAHQLLANNQPVHPLLQEVLLPVQTLLLQ